LGFTDDVTQFASEIREESDNDNGKNKKYVSVMTHPPTRH